MQFPEGEKRIDGIHYEGKNLSYEQNIQHVLNTKAVLEIMQEGADGFTPRVWESIIYDKHLLSNNASLHHSEYYNADFMHDIYDANVLQLVNMPVRYDSNHKNILSPTHLLKFIDELLSC